MYNSSGTTLLNQTNITKTWSSVLSGLTTGQDYYIRLTPNSNSDSGTYKIAYTSSILPPNISVISITAADTWADGNITTAGGEQWFKFTATAATQYIHFSTSGTLKDVYVQVTDDNTTVSTETELYSLRLNTSKGPLTVGNTYYIRVRPYSSTGSGTFKIGFSITATAPTL